MKREKRFSQYYISKFGSADVIKHKKTEFISEPQKGEICMKVKYTSATFTDTMIRKGEYPDVRKKPPFIPGYEAVGIICSIGKDVSSSWMNKTVAALTVTGAYSEYICIPVKYVVEVPEGIPMETALSLQLSFITAYQMLNNFKSLKENDSILIHGAGGAVGTALVQLALLKKCRVYGTASKEKHENIIKMGAIPIDYKQENLLNILKKLEPDGYSAIFDSIGYKSFQSSYKALRNNGFLIAYGFYNSIIGIENKISIIKGLIKLKLWNIIPGNKSAVFYSIISMRNKNLEQYYKDVKKLFELTGKGMIYPVIDRILPISQVCEAHRLIENAVPFGKILLKI